MRIFLFMKRRTNVVDQNRHDIVKGLKTDSRGRRKQIKKVIKSGVGEVKCIKEIKTSEKSSEATCVKLTTDVH